MFSPFCSEPSAPPVTLTMNPNTSLKYEEIIAKSTVIKTGPPAVYQLTTVTKDIDSIRRVTLGEKNINKINKTILLVGETGAGKSTLINTLLNYAMGVKFEDDIWFEIVEEKKRRCPTESQTSDVMMYQIFGFEDITLPFSLTIIDTPGYGNTSGIEHDVIISQRLLDLVRSDKGVHEINAVGLVVKYSDCRLSDRLKYIFDSVMSLFGNDMEKNIVALISHSNGRTPKNALKALEAANIKCAKNEKNQPVYFMFDNCQDDDRTDDIEDLKHADKITMKGMNQFAEFLGRIAPQKLQKTQDVLNERIRLTACINNLQDRIKLIELKQNEIQQTEEALKKHKQKMKKNEEFIVEVDEVYKEKEDIRGGMWGVFFYKAAVTCNICEENCHYPGCTKAWYPKHCEVMKGGCCTVCTRKCPASAHVKENWRYVNKTKKVKKTLEDVKQNYKKNKAEAESRADSLAVLQVKMEDLKAEKIKWLDEAYQHVVNLEQIALNVNSLSTHVHLDFLIEKMKERKDTEKVKKLEEMKSRVDEGVLAALKLMFSKRS